jgi:hypothetical protein
MCPTTRITFNRTTFQYKAPLNPRAPANAHLHLRTCVGIEAHEILQSIQSSTLHLLSRSKNTHTQPPAAKQTELGPHAPAPSPITRASLLNLLRSNKTTPTPLPPHTPPPPPPPPQTASRRWTSNTLTQNLNLLLMHSPRGRLGRQNAKRAKEGDKAPEKAKKSSLERQFSSKQ